MPCHSYSLRVSEKIPLLQCSIFKVSSKLQQQFIRPINSIHQLDGSQSLNLRSEFSTENTDSGETYPFSQEPNSSMMSTILKSATLVKAHCHVLPVQKYLLLVPVVQLLGKDHPRLINTPSYHLLAHQALLILTHFHNLLLKVQRSLINRNTQTSS